MSHAGSDAGGAGAEGGEWFARPGETPPRDGTGLRFGCTMCGNCCSGPEGYVLVSDAEVAALAARQRLTIEAFIASYTRIEVIKGTPRRSLTETMRPIDTQPGAGTGAVGGGATGTHRTYDCVFLDRTTMPGRAVCGVYEDRPAQCRTWPFWPSVLKSEGNWLRARQVCPGMDTGPTHSLVQIRIARDAVEI